MFNKLIASAPDERHWLRNPTVLIVSVAAHLLLLAGIVWASTGPEPVPEPEPEQITYIDITELPPPEPDPEEVFEAPPEDAPVEQVAPRPRAPTPQRAPAVPRSAPATPTTPDEPAGFQEVRVPDVDVSGIPAPDLSAPAVRAEDFGGRGEAGGVASGTPAPAPRTTSTGSGAGGGGGGGTGEDGGTYSAKMVDEAVKLINGNDIARVLGRRYPRQLRDAGVEGRVVVQFVVDTNGRVEAGSIKVVSASNEEFSDPSVAAVKEFRFRPAKRQGRNVRQIVQLPVTWQLDR